jgi:maleylpyruvate isomerase
VNDAPIDARTAEPVPRPVDDLRQVDDAFAQLLAAVDAMTDEQRRGPSQLPGWTRGHVLAHVARSGEGDAITVEASARGEVADKYPGGAEQRERDIEAGAAATLAELRAELVATEDRLVRAWRELPDDAWGGIARTPMGERSAAAGVTARRREILVHLVDLDVGVGPADLPDDYLRDDARFLREYRPGWSDR